MNALNEFEALTRGIKPYIDLTDYPASFAIQMNNCGAKQNYPVRQDVFRPVGRKDYSLLYVSSGWIEVSHEGSMVRLKPGQCILYLPGTSCLNTFSMEGHPTVYYAYFTGTAIRETMDLFGQEPSQLFRVEYSASLRTLFHQMVHLFRPMKMRLGRRPISHPGITGLLFQIIDLLLQSKTNQKSMENSQLLPAVNFLMEHFHEPITLEECVSTVQLSVGRFGHLFTECYGISPHKFLLSLRLDEAKDLLVNSDMNINRIAEKVGFVDPCYFSRLFKKYTGCTPKDYRNQGMNEEPEAIEYSRIVQ